MEDDNGEGFGGVVVPLSLIRMLSDSMLDVIDRWHEERRIHNLDPSMCIIAMLAAIDATNEAMMNYPDGVTVQ